MRKNSIFLNFMFLDGDINDGFFNTKHGTCTSCQLIIDSNPREAGLANTLIYTLEVFVTMPI
jgi:hypothetical protein